MNISSTRKTANDLNLDELSDLFKEIRQSFDDLIKTCDGNNYRNSCPMGLLNVGNTCFMNSVIQALVNTEDLLKLFIIDVNKPPEFLFYVNIHNKMGSGGRAVGNFYSLVLILEHKCARMLTPKRFKQAIVAVTKSFDDKRQHDAQEFLALFIDAMHEDLNQGNRKYQIPEQNNFDLEQEEFVQASRNAWQFYQKKAWSPIYDIFAGQLVSTMECKECGTQSVTFDIFTQITCDIPESHNNTLDDCLKTHLTREEMTNAEWSCPECKEKRAATKEIKLCRLPRTIIVHLKRFKSIDGKIVKDDSVVDFPLTLTETDLISHLHEYSQQSVGVFKLYAIVHHSGVMGQGHYTATCNYDGVWIHFDDDELSDGSNFLTASPFVYLLFYQREDAK